jgi:prepilin-type N-terminal cleavage/methylation domain-containing protein
MHARPVRRAFTLVEILIVVVILGILAAIVTPQFADATEESRRAAFVSELRVFVDAIEYCRARENRYPSDGSTGECPPELAPYVDVNQFEAGTPIGGEWDVEYNDSGVTSAVGVHFQNAADRKDDAYMTLIDALFDDGDLQTGAFRKLAHDRYYYVIAE